MIITDRQNNEIVSGPVVGVNGSDPGRASSVVKIPVVMEIIPSIRIEYVRLEGDVHPHLPHELVRKGHSRGIVDHDLEGIRGAHCTVIILNHERYRIVSGILIGVTDPALGYPVRYSTVTEIESVRGNGEGIIMGSIPVELEDRFRGTGEPVRLENGYWRGIDRDGNGLLL